VYVACPGDDADKLSLPLDKHFFGELFAQNLTLDKFLMKKL
jgi:hypothetical protein